MEKDIVNYVAGGFAVLTSWLARIIWNRQNKLSDKIDKLTDDLHEHQIEATKKPSRDEMHEALKPLNEKMDKLIEFHMKK